MISIRKADFEDLDFLVEIDLLEDGYTTDPAAPTMTDEELLSHRQKITAFVTSPDEGGWIAEDTVVGVRAGLILARFRDRKNEPDNEANRFLFRCLDVGIFPPDGRFCEVFQLWVHPAYRRQGIATQLKILLEEESKKRGIRMIYTHTEEANEHVVEMNRKPGYQEVRRGPLWDTVTRVSLVKWLE